MKVRAVIFGLDGTLVDDGRFHFEAWTRLAPKIGAVMSQSIFQSFNGMTNDDIFRRLLGREIGPALVDALAREKEEHYRELYRPHLTPVAGANELLASLRSAGVKLGIASALSPENLAMVFEALSWNDTFDAVIAPGDLPGKPAPDLYLAAARALDAVPSSCLVFEATWNGANAASSAGMTVAGITTNVDAEVLRRGGAVATYADFTNLPDLESLLP